MKIASTGQIFLLNYELSKFQKLPGKFGMEVILKFQINLILLCMVPRILLAIVCLQNS
jgi:hypothetical protein